MTNEKQAAELVPGEGKFRCHCNQKRQEGSKSVTVPPNDSRCHNDVKMY